MHDQRSIFSFVGLAIVLAVYVALPGVTWAKNELVKNNSVSQVEDIDEKIRLLDAKIPAFSRLGRAGICDVPFSDTDRFVSVLDGGAYCDQKTGLVWERSPAGGIFVWAKAVNHCATLQLGSWKGWSLPIREQLASLVDANSILCRGGGLCLPDGHPFQNVQPAGYWSASTTAGFPNFAWLVNFSFGSVLVKSLDANGRAWCVRDGSPSNRQDLAAVEQPQGN